jgi:[ribosomal protein S18]-alanine N-acetyltransferase
LELLKRGKERGVECATLEVRASNEAAIRLYEGLGFVQSARRKGYYPDNREDAVVMWRYSL